MLIGSFRHKGLKALYEDDNVRFVPAASVAKIKRMLTALEFAEDVSQIATLPGWKLHPLKGSRQAEYSLMVTGNWRITFQLRGNSITQLDLEEYH